MNTLYQPYFTHNSLYSHNFLLFLIFAKTQDLNKKGSSLFCIELNSYIDY